MLMRENSLYLDDIKNVVSQDLLWASLVGKTILITGASGLVGRALIDCIMEKNFFNNLGLKVLAISRNEEYAKVIFAEYLKRGDFFHFSHDVNEPLSGIEPADFVIHAAGNTHPLLYATDPIGTISSQVMGIFHLCDYAVKTQSSRLIFLSSVEIYGENRGDVQYFSEDYCGYINCNSLRAGYVEGKRVAESILNAYQKKAGLDYIIARLCRIYGPTMKIEDTKASSQFIKNALNREDIVLKSPGLQKFSYCYVFDLVSALLLLLTQGESGQAYNIADGKSDITLKELAGIAAAHVGKKVTFGIAGRAESAGFSTAQIAMLDSKKMKGLGWSAKYSIKEGIQRTIDILRKELP